jgi:hypothetical protein
MFIQLCPLYMCAFNDKMRMLLNQSFHLASCHALKVKVWSASFLDKRL